MKLNPNIIGWFIIIFPLALTSHNRCVLAVEPGISVVAKTGVVTIASLKHRGQNVMTSAAARVIKRKYHYFRNRDFSL